MTDDPGIALATHAAGTPEAVAEEPRSHTGRYLKDILALARKRRVAAE